MDILFLRHANAGEPKLDPVKDGERPLDDLGIRQSHDVGRALAALEVTVDAVISSPLLRAAQTASIAASEIGHDGKVIIDAALTPEANYQQFQELLARYRHKSAIMLVGHNPSLTEFLNKLLAGGGDLHVQVVEMKKGSIAKLEKTGRRPAVLKWYMTPKVVRSIQLASASSSRPKTVSK